MRAGPDRWTVTWATLPDSVLVTTCGFVSVPGPVVAMKFWAAGFGGWRRAVAGSHLAALLGRRPSQVTGVRPQAYWTPPMTSRKKTGRQTTNSANPASPRRR